MHLLVIAATVLTVVAVVLVHFEGIVALGRFYENHRTRTARPAVGRRMMLVLMLGLVVLHMVEILMFGSAYWLLLQLPATGSLAGVESASVFDALYLSAMTYSTVGFGDVAPDGPIRWLAAGEALVGLMMVAWSATFAFIEMSRHWDMGRQR